MGKKSKDKKKGKGAEKTATKTDKKQSNKMKKELQKIGEEDIEEIISHIEKEEEKRLETTESAVEAPTRRLNFTFIAHPDKEQLILYGGEFYNGQKTFIYNDLFFYNIPTNTWVVVKAPAGPPPRCSHQMVASSANKGQLWLFGGEFASPSQAQFYHYRDLWVYHISTKRWEKIQAQNGPSARSGHRMVYVKKNLIVFGGFHDNLRSCKYFNDVYSFNTETYLWTKLEPTGTPPAPRSACCMVALSDGKVLVYGGYSKERIKKDVDKGQVYNDAFLLAPDKNDNTGTKWKWVQTKLGGIHFTPRCSMPITSTSNNTVAYCYGGVFDMEDEENVAGIFYNDFYSLDLEKLVWRNVTLSRNKNKEVKESKKQESEDVQMIEIEKTVETTTISDDGIFKVTVGPAISSFEKTVVPKNLEPNIFQPSPRLNCGLAIKHGILYLYGGMFEDGDKQITFNDFYSVDLKKLEEWKVIVADDTSKQEWLGSDNESNDEEEDDEEEESEESEDTDSEMEVDM